MLVIKFWNKSLKDELMKLLGCEASSWSDATTHQKIYWEDLCHS